MPFPLDVLYYIVQYIPDDRDSCAVIQSCKYLNRLGKRNGYRKSIRDCLCEIEIFNTSQTKDIVVEACLFCVNQPKRPMHSDRYPQCVYLTFDKTVDVTGVWKNIRYVVDDTTDMDIDEYTEHEEFIDQFERFFPKVICFTSVDNDENDRHVIDYLMN